MNSRAGRGDKSLDLLDRRDDCCRWRVGNSTRPRGVKLGGPPSTDLVEFEYGTTMGWLLTSSRIPAYIRNCETLSSRPSFAMWNGEQLEQETVEPIGFPREGDVS